MSKYKQVKVNLTEEHHKDLQQKASANNQTLAQYIREQLDIDLKEKPRVRKNQTQTVTYRKADPKLIYHLAAIGNNLNQLTKKINIEKTFDRVALNLINEIREKLNDYKC